MYNTGLRRTLVLYTDTLMGLLCQYSDTPVESGASTLTKVWEIFSLSAVLSVAGIHSECDQSPPESSGVRRSPTGIRGGG